MYVRRESPVPEVYQELVEHEEPLEKMELKVQLVHREQVGYPSCFFSLEM